MTINGISSRLSSQLQTLGNTALNQYQRAGNVSGDNFSFNLSASSTVSSAAGSTTTSEQLSGSSEVSSLIAVGTMTPSGQLDPFSSAQIQSEENLVADFSQDSFADSLQNFLALSQVGSTNNANNTSTSSQVAASAYADQQQFIGDNGLVSLSINTNFSLQSASSSTEQQPSPGSTLSIMA